ncbi:hypothetical protein M8818_000852 [Zalaria obscura]|uniref:Uncharacterized protein n=1 Tax=Zalaria obscura TaxID=2024903 RepID=A0ACC3SMF0_9PEZI
MSAEKDRWSSKAYTSAASFVPQLTTTVVSYLSAQPHERILDIGCGDGPLTAQIAAACAPGAVLGLDASESMIATAQEQHGPGSEHGQENLEFKVHDCTQLAQCADAMEVQGGGWDKVFSNAALHWILRSPSTRMNVLADIYACLKPGGTFVFEMGGKGNVEAVHAATIAALVAEGVDIVTAREACPWFFPSQEWMRAALGEVGFEVCKVEVEYRPTRCTERAGDGSGGLEGWVRLMCAAMLEAAEEGRREKVVRRVVQTLESVVTREEDGSMWLGYVRLRGVARKPEDV